MKAGIARRLLVSFILLSLLPILILSIVFLSGFDKAMSRIAIDHMGEVADKKSDQIDAYFNERLLDIHLLSKRALVFNAVRKIGEAYKKSGKDSLIYKNIEQEFRKNFSFYVDDADYYDMFIILPDGEIIFTIRHESDFATNILKNPDKGNPLREVTDQALNLLQAGISDFRFYQVSGDFAAFIAAPLIEEGKVLGVVALQINNHKVHEVVTDATGLGRTGETLVFRSVGREAEIMAPLRFDRTAAFKLKIPEDSVAGETLRKALKGERGNGIVKDYRDQTVLAVWRYIPVVRWGMIVKIDSSEAYALLYKLIYQSIVIMLLIFFIVLIFAVYTGRQIVRPVRSLINLAEEFTSGNLNARVPDPGQDELGKLGRAFNLMADSLHLSREVLELRVDERTSELKGANEALIEMIEVQEKTKKELRLATNIFENTSEAVIITNGENIITDVNQAYCDITGFNRSELIGQTPGITKSGRHDAGFYRKMWSSIIETGRWTGEIWDRRKNGEIFPKWLTINSIKGKDGTVQNYIGIFSDISHIKQTEERLENLAYYDPLTGLPNRTLFSDRLGIEISRAGRQNTSIALLFIDLDRFKNVNDTLGHSAGDKLLTIVAERIKSCVRQSDTVARLGGDEFTVIISEYSGTVNVSMISRKIIDQVSQPVEIMGQEVFVNASIGISIFPDDAGDRETIVRNADAAMYYAKESGRGNFQFFKEEMNRKSQERLQMEIKLRHAIEKGQFLLYYQPQENLATGEIAGVEALIRWETPDGMVMPDKFIAITEETGLIVEIGAWVLETACRQALVWKNSGVNLRISVNLSPKQFINNDLVGFVRNTLDATGLPPAFLDLEITEGTLMSNVTEVKSYLQELSALGVTFSVDDFGTGYSSLAYLKQFPVSTLKIDRRFIMNIPGDRDDMAISEAIINLGRGLGMDVIAEGVETDEQKNFLIEKGCRYTQGYLLSRPLPAHELDIWLAQRGGIKL